MRRVIVVLLVAGWVLVGQAAQKKGAKVFISVDMEGIWGVVNSEQISPGAEYGNARSWMAGDTNAVIEGLLEAGATEIVVNDSHGSMRNIVASDLNPRASLITGTPKPLSMMQGIDPSFDAALLIGYHARAGSAPAILDHTISSAAVRSVRINGKELPEMGINGAIAGYYGVPVIMLSGDTETCAQAKALFGSEIVTSAVKEAIGRTAARLLPLEEARRRLRESAKDALAKRGSIPPYKLSPPYTFELELNSSLQAEPAMLIPGVRRVNPRTVTFGATDYIEGFKLLRGLIALAAAS
jgi:D-amino peptidase